MGISSSLSGLQNQVEGAGGCGSRSWLVCAPSPSAVGLGISPTSISTDAQELLGSQVNQSHPTLCDFSSQEYWSRVPFLSPGELPDPGIEPGSPALRADSLPSEPPGKPRSFYASSQIFPGSNQVLVSLLPRRPNFVRQPFSCARHSGH